LAVPKKSGRDGLCLADNHAALAGMLLMLIVVDPRPVSAEFPG